MTSLKSGQFLMSETGGSLKRASKSARESIESTGRLLISEEEIQKIFDAAKPAIESTLDKLIEDYEEGRLFSAGQQSAFLKLLLVSLEEPLPPEDDREWIDEVAEVINNIDAREGCA